jgi:hypothetical protein
MNARKREKTLANESAATSPKPPQKPSKRLSLYPLKLDDAFAGGPADATQEQAAVNPGRQRGHPYRMRLFCQRDNPEMNIIRGLLWITKFISAQ